MKRFYLSFLLIISAVIHLWAQQTVAAEGAWCWFADPRALHYENADKSINMSYLGYIDVHGNIMATQMNFNTGQKTDVLVRSYFQPDDHNNPTFLVLPDERVLIIYSRHTDEAAFYYRVSRTPGDITTLGAERKIVTKNNTTYPSPFVLSDDPEHFYLCWRGISWHPTIARITLPDAEDNVTVDWGPYQMVQSTGARPYAKYYSNGKDKLYVTYTTGHPDNEQPNWIYFNVININATTNGNGTTNVRPTLNDITGTQLSVIENGAFKVNKTDSYKSKYPKTIVDAPTNVRDWVWQIALDQEERPRIAMVKINGGKTQHQYYYARWTGKQWVLTDLCDGGYKFHPSNTEYCYSGGMSLDVQNPGDVYVSKPTTGMHGDIFELWKYSVDDNGQVTESKQLTHNSTKNNVRPFVLPGSKDSPLRLGWMHGDYSYWMVNKNYPTGYPTCIQWDYTYEVPLHEAPTCICPDAFSITANIELDVDKYEGTLLETQFFSYILDGDTQTPYMEINGSRYYSTNRLLNSDNWALNSTGTSGDYWPTKLSNVNLCINVNGKVVEVYRNGYLDQHIEMAKEFELANATEEIWARKGGKQPDGIKPSTLTNPDAVWSELQQGALDNLYVPAEAHTDLVLPTIQNGTPIQWSSSAPEIIATDGTYTSPDTPTTVTLTATTSMTSRTFNITALPRNTEQALRASYTFDPTDTYTENGKQYVRSLCSKALPMTVMGNATIDGTLNLKKNTTTGFSTNGYGIIAPTLLDSLRSYTVLVEIEANSLTAAPRIYDFGVNSQNSLFLRANTLCAGIKYAGGSTTMTSSETQLKANQAYKLAVAYDARTKRTAIYVNGQLMASGRENTHEPYELTMVGLCNRNYVGRTQWWDSNVAKDNADFIGTIDNLSIYDIALTQDEVMQAQDITPRGEAEMTLLEGAILNAGFEGSYQPMTPSTMATDRAIQWPEGWTVTHTQANEYDMSIITTDDAQSALFTTIPPQEGNAAYRVRQNWGTSTITLTQATDTLPAGAYQLRAQVWQSGLGGQARISTTSLNGTATQSPTANAEMWQTVDVPFLLNGQQRANLMLSAVHNSNGSTKYIGFDHLQLYNRDASADNAELMTLINALIPQGEDLLQKHPDNDMLSNLLQQASQAKDSDAQPQLLQLFIWLRDEINATRNLLTAIALPNAITTEHPAYDLSGRIESYRAHGIYIRNGQKTIK